MQREKDVSAFERLNMPSNTKWTPTINELLNDLKGIDNYDADGKCGDCILKITITGHGGDEGDPLISLGNDLEISPAFISLLKQYLNKYKNPTEEQKKQAFYKLMNERVMSIENALKTIAKYSLKYKCKDGVTIDFAQCHSWNGEIVKFLRSYFDADINILLYEKKVKWFFRKLWKELDGNDYIRKKGD